VSLRGCYKLIIMCGRYRLARNIHELMEFFGVEESDLNWEPHYNIAPTQNIVAVRQHPKEPRRELSLMRWGLVPYWAKDISVGVKAINAVSETVTEKPTFREAIRRRRCLIPADGFYEWKKLSAKEKQPYNSGVQDGGIFAMAGLWERWKDAEGKQLESCSVLTTSANALLQDIHHRMPVILKPEDYDQWLDPGITDPQKIAHLLQPLEARLMRTYPVSARVNSVKNDDPACAEPVTISQTASLFG